MLCSKCNKLCDENVTCRKCKCVIKKKKSNFVVKICIEQQIKYLFNKHFDKILKHMNREKDPNYISDIDEGILFERVSKKIENSDRLLSFTINSDGAPIYKSSTVSMWPIQLYANFLPPDIRFKNENILLYMLYAGKKKPNLTEIFYPLAEEINELQKKKLNLSTMTLCCVYICAHCYVRSVRFTSPCDGQRTKAVFW